MQSTGTDADKTENSNTEAVNILSLDRLDVAAAVGRLAAARVHALMTKPADVAGVDLHWFDLAGVCVPNENDSDEEKHRKLAAGAALVKSMAEYTIKKLEGRTSDPEQLHRRSASSGQTFQDMSDAHKTALAVFIATVKATAQEIAVLQFVARAADPKGPMAQPLKREDSIFEATESLGALEPHAIEAAKLQKQRAAEQTGRATDEAANSHALSVGQAEPDGDIAEANQAPPPVKAQEPEKPLSAGEKPPATSTVGSGKTHAKKPRASRKATKGKTNN